MPERSCFSLTIDCVLWEKVYVMTVLGDWWGSEDLWVSAVVWLDERFGGMRAAFMHACFPNEQRQPQGISLWVVWAHLPRWTSLNLHPPTHEQWQVLPDGWLKGPCVVLELNLGCEHRNSLTWQVQARISPQAKPRHIRSGHTKLVATAKSGWVLVVVCFLWSDPGLPRAPKQTSGRVWTHLGSRAGELTQMGTGWKGPPSLCGVTGRSKWNRTG